MLKLCLLWAFLLLHPAQAAIPAISGYHVRWGDDFNGPAGDPIDSDGWWVQGWNVGKLNGEQQEYNNITTKNVHLSGDGQLYIIPYRDLPNNGWSSGRVHTKHYWTPQPGKTTIYRAEIWVPDFTNSPASTDGLWPAFWTKGNNNRLPPPQTPTPWPKCGEWDILEVSPNLGGWNQGTLHYQDGAGINRTKTGQVQYTGGQYHTWSFKVNRQSSDVNDHRLEWLLDGVVWQTRTRGEFGASAWSDLATKPYFIILNVAVGAWQPGFTNLPSQFTVSGWASSMRVRYVAVYESD